MPDNRSDNKRIAKNAILLYFRMIIIMGVTLFTSRVILQSLGVEDYGLYNVVGGIVAIFSFVSSSMIAASQRYITFELGKGCRGDVTSVFSTCLLLHIILAIIISLIAEPIGIWFINNKLLIPESRLTAAMWVFHFSILSMIIMLISVPYNALIVAHEKMNVFAWVSIVDALLRLFIAYSILFFSNADKLILYGLLMVIAQIIIRFCYTIYCKKAFPSIALIWKLDRNLLVEMGKFASWSILGNVAFITYTQGLNLLLGMFFCPVVNAARGIAVQVQGAVNTFVNSFQTAINPQITKNYAAGDVDKMITLVFRSSRFSFYLLMIVSVPVLLRTHDILSFWLGNIPDHTIAFMRIILLTTWINSIANPLIISVKATGNIKQYESTVGGLMIAILPISYIFLKLGYRPETVFIVHLIIECIAMIFRIWNAHSLIKFSYRKYVREVVLRISVVSFISILFSFFISSHMPNGVISSFITIFLSILISLVTIVLFGLDKSEKSFFLSKIKR